MYKLPLWFTLTVSKLRLFTYNVKFFILAQTSSMNREEIEEESENIEKTKTDEGMSISNYICRKIQLALKRISEICNHAPARDYQTWLHRM